MGSKTVVILQREYDALLAVAKAARHYMVASKKRPLTFDAIHWIGKVENARAKIADALDDLNEVTRG